MTVNAAEGLGTMDNTAPGGYVAPGTDFDSFMGTVRKIGAQPILIANYGTGTPQEAAGWRNGCTWWMSCTPG